MLDNNDLIPAIVQGTSVLAGGVDLDQLVLEQVPFGDVEFALNPEPRVAVALLLDVSSSMDGDPIAALNAALRDFADEVKGDHLASKRVDLAVIPFSTQVGEGVFEPGHAFQPPELVADGYTAMGAAIVYAIDLVKLRVETYRREGLQFYKPWVLLITDGHPTDSIEEAAQRVHVGTRDFTFFAVGVTGADMGKLRQISVRQPLELDGLKFAEFFVWLSASLCAVSASMAGTEVLLPPVSDWAQV